MMNSNLSIIRIKQMSNSVQQLYLKVKNKEIELDQISLLKLIEDYLSYLLIANRESINLEIVANFIIAISELILWKSNLLLPSSCDHINEEAADNSAFLKEDNLMEYKKYQSLVKILTEKELKQKNIYLKIFNYQNDFQEVPQEYNYSDLFLAIESILNRNNNTSIIDFKDNEINITKKMEEIEEKLFTNGNKLTFSQIISKNCNKIEIIIVFLALLHLIYQGKIDYVQSQNFGEILFYRKEDKKLKKNTSYQR